MTAAEAKKERCKAASQCEFMTANVPRGGTRPIGSTVDLTPLFPLRCPPGAPVTVEFAAPGIRDDMTVQVQGSFLKTAPAKPSASLATALDAAKKGGTDGGSPTIPIQVTAKVKVNPPDNSCRTASAEDTLFFQDPIAMLAAQMTTGFANAAAADELRTIINANAAGGTPPAPGCTGTHCGGIPWIDPANPGG